MNEAGSVAGRVRSVMRGPPLSIVLTFAAAPHILFLNNNRSVILPEEIARLATYGVVTKVASVVLLMLLAVVFRGPEVEQLTVGLAAFLLLAFNFHRFEVETLSLR